MQTKTDVTPTYLTQAKSAIAPAPGAGSSSALPLSDFYGYIIDLAFRTNVAGSSLQLQTAAVDRIYSDNTTNENTMGGGTTMIFKSSDTNFTPARMIELMKHLKVIIFDPTSGEIIKSLVPTNVSTEIITDADGTVTVPLYVADKDGNLITRQKTENGTPVTDAEGKAVMENDPTVVALHQNTIMQLSVLVYLDGTNLTNADVANAAQSMVGALNLQFSSSAELVPMEYADLRNGTVEAPDNGSTEVETTPIDLSKVSITEGYKVTMARFAASNGAGVIAATVTADDGTVIDANGYTVTINEQAAEFAHDVWAAGVLQTEAPESVTIVVTPNP